MPKRKCYKCGALMPYIPDKGGYVCLQCGNTNIYNPKPRKRWFKSDDEYQFEEY